MKRVRKSKKSISKITYKKPKKLQRKPKKDNKVNIIIKPYKKKIIKSGIVNKVLTKKKYHSRGHKVKLKSGNIGRVIYKKK